MPLANIDENTPDDESNKPPSLEAPTSKISKKESMFDASVPANDTCSIPLGQHYRIECLLPTLMPMPQMMKVKNLSLEAPPSKKTKKESKVWHDDHSFTWHKMLLSSNRYCCSSHHSEKAAMQV